MDFHFPGNGAVKIDMRSYLKEPIEESPEALDRMVTSPAVNHIFKVNTDTIKLDEERHELLAHQLVTKLLFVPTRARPDIHLPISFIALRVEMADKDNWKKLKPLMQYKHCTTTCFSIKHKKRFWVVKEVQYLGYIILTDGVWPVPNKIAAVLRLAAPTTLNTAKKKTNLSRLRTKI